MQLGNIPKLFRITCAPILGFGSFAFAVWGSALGVDSDREVVIAAMASLVIALVVDRIIDQMESNLAHRNTDERFRRLHRSIDQASGIQIFKDDEELQSHLIRRLSVAKKVKNTFISFGQLGDDFDADSDQVIARYRAFFENSGAEWTDVVGIGDFFGPRFARLRKEICSGSSHVVQVVRHTAPVMNFCLISSSDDDNFEEVVVTGFRTSNTVHNSAFYSAKPEVVRLFASYFSLLESYGNGTRPAHLNYANWRKNDVARLTDMVDRKGRWITLGYQLGNSEPQGSRKTEILSIGMIDISFQDQTVVIEGQVLWSECSHRPKFVEIIDHDPKNVHYTPRSIFLEYRMHEILLRGVCVYKFKNSGGQDQLTGYLQDETSGRIQLAGLRIKEDWPPISKEIILDSKESIFKIIKSHALDISHEEVDDLLEFHSLDRLR